jgi:hypothetical protein
MQSDATDISTIESLAIVLSNECVSKIRAEFSPPGDQLAVAVRVIAHLQATFKH